MINFTIIIPHRNCPNLLNNLLDTIPQRQDLQVIVIDDNSDPGVVDFNQFPGINRPDVEIVYKKSGGGAGAARNEGLRKAKGKWLLFADSDDSYNYYELEKVFNKYATDSHTDIVYMNAQKVFEDDSKPVDTFISPYIKNYIEKKPYSELVLRFGVWEPWNRMVKRHIVESYNIWFDEIPVGNDQMFSLKCSKYSQTLNVYPGIVYNYFQPKGRSITAGNRKKLENLPSYISLKMRANDLYSSVGYPFKFSFIKTYIRANDGSENKAEYRRVFRDTLKGYNYCFIKDMCNFIIHIVAKLLKII